MINRADQGVMAGLTDEVVEIQFGAVPAVIVHIVHRFCSNGGAAVGGLMDGPVRHAPGQCGWAFIFRREKREGSRPAVLRQPPVYGRQIGNPQVLVNESRPGVNQRGSACPLGEDGHGIPGAACDGADGLVMVQLKVNHQGHTFIINLAQDAKEVVHLG